MSEQEDFEKEVLEQISIPSIELVEVEKLKVDGKNPNKMSERQKEALAKNFKKFGFIVPIITNKDYLIEAKKI